MSARKRPTKRAPSARKEKRASAGGATKRAGSAKGRGAGRGGASARSGVRSGARPALRALADRFGIIHEYVDQTGKERRQTSDATREALLGAMRIDASTEESARAALDALEARESARGLAPVRVLPTERLGEGIPLADVGAKGVEWSLAIHFEDGAVRELDGRAKPKRGGTAAAIELPADLPAGYHDVRLVVRDGGGERVARQRLIVVPSHCPRPEELLQGERVFGVTANLYTVRSERNWGFGDATDLANLLEWTADVGGAFVGVNPLHALRNRGGDISPYSPVSRIFRNVLYIDPEAVPELAESEEARDRCDSRETRAALAALRSASRIDYARAMKVKMPALESLHRTFARLHRDRDTSRGRAYAIWLQQQGGAVDDWATFCVLEEHFAGRATRWREWPPEYRDPRSATVREFRERHPEQVDLHRWLQFELDRQLGEAARRGRKAGMPIGLYQDLAIGASPDGSDTWLEPELFVSGASVGAPPDPYAATGQNWGLPPLDPRVLADTGYDYWVRLLRSSLRHAGALRIDHVMGLFRQYWIPEGKRGSEGAYVRFPSEDLLGILALEATRANALVVGEDLGTVPPDVPPAMERWGLLSSKVLYFERDRRGGFRRANDYAPMALATANTHDMATLAGFWRGRDIELRREVQLIPDAKAEKAERAARVTDKVALVRLLRDEGTLPANETPERDVALRAAVHAFLRRTPSWLVGLSLDDIVGEVEPVNVPGVGPDTHPSWTRRLGLALERFRDTRDVRRALGVERWWVGGSTGLRPARPEE
jgi:4-alpha-glucanotransferase